MLLVIQPCHVSQTHAMHHTARSSVIQPKPRHVSHSHATCHIARSRGILSCCLSFSHAACQKKTLTNIWCAKQRKKMQIKTHWTLLFLLLLLFCGCCCCFVWVWVCVHLCVCVGVCVGVCGGVCVTCLNVRLRLARSHWGTQWGIRDSRFLMSAGTHGHCARLSTGSEENVHCKRCFAQNVLNWREM